MWKLICYEMKKMLSSLSGKIALVLFLGICIWQVPEDIAKTKQISFANMEDVVLLQKELEGRYDMKKEIPNLAYDRIHINKNRVLDEKATDEMNPFDWKQIYQAYEKGTLTLDMVNDLIKDPELKAASLKDFTINYAYQDDDTWDIVMRLLPEEDVMVHREKYMYDEKALTSGICVLGDCNQIEDTVSRKEINRRFLSLPDEYHSNAMGNALFDTLGYTNFLMLMMMAILFANIFSKETQMKTDVYLAYSPNGGVKVIWAKLFLCLAIGVGIPLLAKGWILAVTLYESGFDWSMFYYDQGGMVASYIFTFKELIPIAFINMLIGLVSLCICILFMSQKSKNSYIAAVGALIFVMFPIYFGFFNLGGTKLISLFPSNLLMRLLENLSANTYGADSHQLFVSLFGWVIPKVAIYWIFLIIINTILMISMIREGKRHCIISHS